MTCAFKIIIYLGFFVKNLIFKQIKKYIEKLSLYIYTVHVQTSLHCDATRGLSRKTRVLDPKLRSITATLGSTAPHTAETQPFWEYFICY